MSAVLAPLACFHCGLPVPSGSAWRASVNGVDHPMCCPGCEAVANSIVASGFGDYYSTRTEYAATTEGDGVVPPQLRLYDRRDQGAGAPDDGAAGEGSYSVEGIRCAACVWLIERRLAQVPGVVAVEMNVATERLHVRWAGGQCRPSVILQALHEIGYAAYPYDPVRHGEQLERARKKLFRQLFIAGLSMMQVMMYALPVYLADDGTMDADMRALMHWASLLLTLPAVLYSAQPFFRGALNNLRARMLGMDVPVALGIGAAFGGSVVALVSGAGDVYFDSITMFIFLLLASRYLELSARRKAARALEDLQHALPASAQRMPGYPERRETELVGAGQLRAGDVMLVRPGESIAADCVILEGDTEVELALLTGESRARRMQVGASLPGGAVNASQPIVVRVERGASESTLSTLVKLVEGAGLGKPQISLWADKVAAWFVAGLLLLTVLVFFGWQMVDPARAWQVAVAVLVVSCPCALSLATPSALAAATDRLVRQGVLIVQPHVLETLQRATHIIFDKTGTLTVGRPVLRQVDALGMLTREQCLQVAAALEHGSAHPLALAIREAAGGQAGHAHSLRHVAGQGVEGVIDGRHYRLGCAAFFGGVCTTAPAPSVHDDASRVYLAADGSWLARFIVADALRADAQAVVRQFQARGRQVILLSGDEQGVVANVAAELGIATAWGGQLPEQKLAYVQSLQRAGAVVAMVGDGVNDAAVLSAADVSFAMGGGAALAQMHADCVLLSGRLGSMNELAATAAATLSVIRQNLAWATLYNLVAIPAAAFGLLNPWMAGLGMSLSSAVVVVNALRLRRPGA